MHKGYTLNYFIDFFSSIPDHQWCTKRNQNGDTVQHCAAGHALRDKRTTLGNSLKENQNRYDALANFLGCIESINDATGKSQYRKLGKTPRGRILKALRNVKRTGDVFGNN